MLFDMDLNAIFAPIKKDSFYYLIYLCWSNFHFIIKFVNNTSEIKFKHRLKQSL